MKGMPEVEALNAIVMTIPENKTARQKTVSLLQSRLFRIAVSVLLLGLLLTRLDLRELGSILGNVSPGLLLLGVFVFLVANMISVFKWRLIIQAQGADVSFFLLVSFFYMGLFFNNFLPTTFGGDVVKAFKLAKITGRGAEAASSVVLDRASSMFGLLLIAVVPALVQLRLLGGWVVLLVLAMLAIFLLLIVVVASKRIARRLGGLWLFRFDPFGLRLHLKSFYFSLHEFRNRGGTLAWVLLISLVYQVVHILTVYVLALALGIDVQLVYYFIFIPIVLAIGMIPVSLNGLGVREGAWVLLFSQVGISTAAAFSMSILNLLVMMVVSLAGGVFYIFDKTARVPDGDTTNG
jgi:uncharacterized protein (TIRG00374 family)